MARHQPERARLSPVVLSSQRLAVVLEDVALPRKSVEVVRVAQQVYRQDYGVLIPLSRIPKISRPVVKRLTVDVKKNHLPTELLKWSVRSRPRNRRDNDRAISKSQRVGRDHKEVGARSAVARHCILGTNVTSKRLLIFGCPGTHRVLPGLDDLNRCFLFFRPPGATCQWKQATPGTASRSLHPAR